MGRRGTRRSQNWLRILAEKHRSKPCTVAPLAGNLLVGPEGASHENEVETAVSHGFHRLALGPRILRTDCAFGRDFAAPTCLG